MVTICIFPEVGFAWVILQDIAPIVLSISANILVQLVTSTLTKTFAISEYLYEQMAS